MWEPRDQPLPGSFPKKDPGYEVDKAQIILFKMAAFRVSWSGQNVSNNFVKIFNELYLFSIDFAWCLTLGIFASLVNAFFLMHDSENPKFGSSNNSCSGVLPRARS